MTKFHRMQRISSIIPIWSTFIIVIVTMVELKRRKASIKLWFYFVLTFFLFGIVVYLVNTFIMTGQHIVLNVIISGLILAIANILFVNFQVMSAQSQYNKEGTNNKKVIYCIAAGVVVVLGVVILISAALVPSVDIEDSNGSNNTSLAVIDTNEILSNTNNFSAFSSKVSQSGGHTDVVGKLKKYDYDEVTFCCKKISGIKTLQVTKSISEQITLEIDSQLYAGNMEIIIIVDDEYYDSVAVNKISSVMLTGVRGKTVVVKIAAESAQINISVKRLV